MTSKRTKNKKEKKLKGRKGKEISREHVKEKSIVEDLKIVTGIMNAARGIVGTKVASARIAWSGR